MGRHLAGTPWAVAGEVPDSELLRRLPLPADSAAVLDRARDRGEITALGARQVTRVAWTRAALAGRDRPHPADTGQALACWLGRSR
jgi:magnesium chelatase family protein